jgi:transposase
MCPNLKAMLVLFSLLVILFQNHSLFNHTEEGMKQVRLVLDQIQAGTNTKPTVVLEATGNYSKSLVHYFKAFGYDVVILNPLTTSTPKRKSMRKVKTDPIYTYRIAQVYYLNNYSPDISIDEKYEELRNLCSSGMG